MSFLHNSKITNYRIKYCLRVVALNHDRRLGAIALSRIHKTELSPWVLYTTLRGCTVTFHSRGLLRRQEWQETALRWHWSPSPPLSRGSDLYWMLLDYRSRESAMTIDAKSRVAETGVMTILVRSRSILLIQRCYLHILTYMRVYMLEIQDITWIVYVFINICCAWFEVCTEQIQIPNLMRQSKSLEHYNSSRWQKP